MARRTEMARTSPEEFSSDEELLAWESEGWDQFSAEQ